MDFLSTFSSLTDVLHALAQALLVPDIVLLLLFAGYALFSIGSILMEYFTERRNFKVAMPEFLAALMAAEENTIPEVIRSSQLLNRQKSALLTVFDYRTLPGDALLALIRRTVNAEETHYNRITGRNNTAAKISPMLGLMGTLIPLGPGVAALGQADPTILSSSLLIAFDTTVAGLAVAAVCLAVGKIRSGWYNDYLSALDSGMATLLEKIEEMRKAGKIVAKEPSNYAFMFEEGLKKSAAETEEAPTKTESQIERPQPATSNTGAHSLSAYTPRTYTGTSGTSTSGTNAPSTTNNPGASTPYTSTPRTTPSATPSASPTTPRATPGSTAGTVGTVTPSTRITSSPTQAGQTPSSTNTPPSQEY